MTTTRFTSAQFEYLLSATYLDPRIHRALAGGARTVNDGTATIVVLEDGTREQLQEALTERLARVGFDADYKLTAEGALLEELIDSSS